MQTESRFHFIERVAFNKGYRVSPCGQIVKLRDNPPRSLQVKDGYLEFSVSSMGGKTKPCRVHRLQAYQKFGELIYDNSLEVRHLDGNQKNNAADNLEMGTPSQNHMDKTPEVRRRAALIASRTAQKHDHLAVRSFYAVTQSYKKTMECFGISSKGTLHFILFGRKPKPVGAKKVPENTPDHAGSVLFTA